MDEWLESVKEDIDYLFSPGNRAQGETEHIVAYEHAPALLKMVEAVNNFGTVEIDSIPEDTKEAAQMFNLAVHLIKARMKDVWEKRNDDTD